ncbi:MAG TPA: hypothetical protein VJQ43_05015, partial [Thermoplasmata archaeon]|nr:hypothetical protein [Thermoplasmata archaeon]
MGALLLVAVPTPASAGSPRPGPASELISAIPALNRTSPAFDSIGGWVSAGGSANRSGYTPVGGPLSSDIGNAFCPSYGLPLRAGPVAAGPFAFVADVFGDVYALNRTNVDHGGGNHTIAWSASVGTNPTTPDVSSGSLLVGDSAGLVSAFDVETGGLRWSHALNGSVEGGVAVVNGT